MNYYFYAIQSQRDQSIYKGISRNPYARLRRHNSGQTKSTKGKIPYKIVYIEKCNDRQGARSIEKYYKSGAGREKLYKLIKTQG